MITFLYSAAGICPHRTQAASHSCFSKPEEARWSTIAAAAHTPEIGTVIDNAMRAIEAENKTLKNVLPKNYASPDLDKRVLGDVVDIFTNNIDMRNTAGTAATIIYTAVIKRAEDRNECLDYDMLDSSKAFAAKFPPETDIFISTSSADKKPQIEAAFADLNVRSVRDRGGEPGPRRRRLPL